MTTSDLVAREVVVHGRVQGVFFRASCHEEAEQQSVVGWVSNEPDGSVRAWFEGSAEQVRSMCAWCEHGPAHARVNRVDTVEREPKELRAFVVR